MEGGKKVSHQQHWPEARHRTDRNTEATDALVAVNLEIWEPRLPEKGSMRFTDCLVWLLLILKFQGT